MKKKIGIVLLLSILLCSMTGCNFSFLGSKINDLRGQIRGNTYEVTFYSNTGDLFMTANGQKIDMDSNVVREPVYSDGSWGYTETMSSVVTITIDGKQIESCGSTILFEEDGLKKDMEFTLEDIESNATKLSDNTMVAGVVNKYKNAFGKPTVVVIQSQLGNPICAYSGDKVYWELSQDLPKTTKLMIDGKALYVHRANFQIIDKALLK